MCANHRVCLSCRNDGQRWIGGRHQQREQKARLIGAAGYRERRFHPMLQPELPANHVRSYRVVPADVGRGALAERFPEASASWHPPWTGMLPARFPCHGHSHARG